MPKSLIINDPESTLSCDTWESLEAEYRRAMNEFSESLKKHRNAKRIPARERELVERANVKVETARRALRNHMIEHGCG